MVIPQHTSAEKVGEDIAATPVHVCVPNPAIILDASQFAIVLSTLKNFTGISDERWITFRLGFFVRSAERQTP